MGTRGRQSAAELTVIASSGIIPVSRPRPPEYLTDEQAEEWRAIVNVMPADRFGPETVPLLAGYCRHAVASRHIGQLISTCEAAEELDLAEYDRLLKMQERESRCLASLAVRLGLAITTTHERKKANSLKKPWQE